MFEQIQYEKLKGKKSILVTGASWFL